MSEPHTLDAAHEKNGQAYEEAFEFPATEGQLGFWYLDKVRPGEPAYNIAVRFLVRGRLAEPAIRRALTEVARRHEALRTVFAAPDGVLAQVVYSRPRVPLVVNDLSGLAVDQRRGAAEELAGEEARLAFDLRAGPLFRARLVRLGEEEQVLMLTAHHIICDGWSMGLISRELAELLEADSRGEASPLAEPMLQYGDYAVWQQGQFESGAMDAQLAYWRGRLEDLAPAEVPTDFPRPQSPTHKGAIESVLLPKHLTQQLHHLSQREGATFFAASLACLNLLLRQYSESDDMAVGTPSAGRSSLEMEGVVGLFINPVVLRVGLSGEPTFRKLLGRARDAVAEALANQDVPFAKVVQAVRPRFATGQSPLFRVNFILQRAFLKPHQGQSFTWAPVPSVSPGAMYDLTFFLIEREEGWRASLEYDLGLYQADTARRLLQEFGQMVEAATVGPDRPISALAPRKSMAGSRISGPAVEVPARPAAVPTTPAYRGARADIESRLAAIWGEVLQVDSVGHTQDFFDLGGHSLLAARLLTRVEKEFGIHLPFASLLQSPTVASLAARIRLGKLADESDEVHAIQPSGRKPPWVVMTSQPQMYRSLANHLGPDQPVLGLTSPELAEFPAGFTLEDVARHHVRALRTAVPHGPYYLGGWCVSGVVALEVARQLQQEGEEVALLVLLDTNSPAYLRGFHSSLGGYLVRWYLFFERMAYHAGAFLRLPVSQLWGYLGERFRSFSRWFVSEPETPLTRFARLQRRAAYNYVVQPTTVPIVLFRTSVLQTGLFRDPLLGWAPLARGGLTLNELPGDHDELFHEPDVEQLGRQLREALDRAVARSGQGLASEKGAFK
jgi:thioesterase domain-containing protein/acyl carrier protein